MIRVYTYRKLPTINIIMNAYEFFEKNKNFQWVPPPIPPNLTNNFEIAKWVLNELDFGWIQLDLDIDLNQWKIESKEATFQKHRGDDHPGWNSCCIHGIYVDKTGAWTTYGYTNEDEVPYKWTSISAQTPTIKNFWQNSFPSDRYRRIRFMELEAKGIISPHSDMPGRLPGEENFDALAFGVPVNIAVVHPEDCFMVLEGKGIVPFKEGSAFIVNIRHYHSVINFSNTPRIHVIGHSFGYGSKLENFSELIARSYRKQYAQSC
jgi:hypothetical protein